MSTIASNDSLCGPLNIPSVIPGVDQLSDFCATPIMGNQTLNIMEYCCASQVVHTVDSCAYCYLTESMLENEHTMDPTMRFAACVVRRAKETNATMQRLTSCHTPNWKNAAAGGKGVSGWKVGVVAVLIGTALSSL